SGKATCFYLFYRSQPFHEPVIHPLADQYEAAAFIIGLAGMELAGITDAEQKRIRNYFPDVFGYGDK
ncbi:MAG: hypothetical protein LUQ71_08475, partial [Methanoregula sp.]|nr:hypothetical protein [Methanoregula sp.]